MNNDTIAVIKERIKMLDERKMLDHDECRALLILIDEINTERVCCSVESDDIDKLRNRINYIEEFDIAMLNSRFSTLLDKVLELDNRVRELYHIKPIV